MKAKTCLALAIAAGCASVASANPEKITVTGQQGMNADNIGHIYYNLATGEMVKTPPATSSRGVTPLWVNEIYDQCGFAEWYYYGLKNTGTAADNYWLDWGDIANDSVVDSMNLLLATDVNDPEEDGVEGFEADFSLFDALDYTNTNSGIAPDLILTITNLPGVASGGVAGWLLTIDLSGGNEITMGNTDTDADGNADFGYGWNFRFPEDAVANVAGFGLVVPPEGVEPNSLGDPDGMGLSFDQNWATTNPNYWFGGYDCTGGAGFNWGPWGSYYLGLYAAGGEPGPCNDADVALPYNELNFGDVQTYLGWFSGGDLRADLAPVGNPDGVLNFGDVQYFLGQFSGGCP